MVGILTTKDETITIRYDQESKRVYVVITDESEHTFIGKIKLKEVAKDGTV